MFLILMVIGLVGLAMMAIPAFGRHGHAAGSGHSVTHAAHHGGALGHGHGMGHGGHAAAAPAAAGHAAANPCSPAHPCAPSHPAGHPAGQVVRSAADARDAAMDVVAPGGMTRFLPSPRAVFSMLALYGAFGNALHQAAHLPVWAAAAAALVPALLVERFAVTPLWNTLFRFQGAPSAPLTALVLGEARAVIPFRNGKGVVSVVRDGRLVQLAARLTEGQAGKPVRVGDRLVVEEVDAPNERLTVSIPV